MGASAVVDSTLVGIAMTMTREPGYYWVICFLGDREITEEDFKDAQVAHFDGNWNFCGAEESGYAESDDPTRVRVVSERLPPPGAR
jgi:allantoicase